MEGRGGKGVTIRGATLEIRRIVGFRKHEELEQLPTSWTMDSRPTIWKPTMRQNSNEERRKYDAKSNNWDDAPRFVSAFPSPPPLLSI